MWLSLAGVVSLAAAPCVWRWNCGAWCRTSYNRNGPGWLIGDGVNSWGLGYEAESWGVNITDFNTSSAMVNGDCPCFTNNCTIYYCTQPRFAFYKIEFSENCPPRSSSSTLTSQSSTTSTHTSQSSTTSTLTSQSSTTSTLTSSTALSSFTLSTSSKVASSGTSSLGYYISIVVVVAFVIIAVLLLRRRRQAKRWINHDTALIPDYGGDCDDKQQELQPVIYDRIQDAQYNAAYTDEHTYAVPTLLPTNAAPLYNDPRSPGNGNLYNDPRSSSSVLEFYDDPRASSAYNYNDPRKT